MFYAFSKEQQNQKEKNIPLNSDIEVSKTLVKTSVFSLDLA